MKDKSDSWTTGTAWGLGWWALGAVLPAAIANKFQGPGQVRKPGADLALDSRYVYDISEFETTDPKLLLLRAWGAYSPLDSSGRSGWKAALRAADSWWPVIAPIKVLQCAGGVVGVRDLRCQATPHCLLVDA